MNDKLSKSLEQLEQYSAYLKRPETCWKKFMLESNQIEGEDHLNPGDERAFKLALQGFEHENEILECHRILTEHLGVNWSGKYRDCNVRVGSYVAPKWQDVPKLMKEFIDNYHNWDSWETHNRFEKIHSFQDFNGRVGRLIWISKAIHESYDIFRVSFLRMYYYQTLDKFESEEIGLE